MLWLQMSVMEVKTKFAADDMMMIINTLLFTTSNCVELLQC